VNNKKQKSCRAIVREPILNNNYVLVRIGRKLVKGLIDTGSVTTIINEKIARQLGLKFGPTDRTVALYSANGSRMPVTANVDITLYFSGLSIPHTAKVVKRLEHDLILGADFLSQNHVIIDYKENMVSIADDLVRVPLQSLQNKEDYVTTISSTCIPAFSEATIPVGLPQQYNNKTVLLEPSKHFQFRQFATARSLSNCQNGKTVCTVLNYNPQTLVLKKGIKIATVENIDTLQSCIPYVEKKTRSGVAAVSARLEDTDTRADLDEFLEEYKFLINNKDITEE